MGANLGKRCDREVVHAKVGIGKFTCRGGLEAVTMVGEVGVGGVRAGWRCYYSKERKAREVPRARRLREGLRHLSDVTQQDNRESLGPRTL